MEWLQRKVVRPVQAQLSSGATPEKLAMSFAVGITCGLFPIPGTTMIVCGFATVATKVNPVIPQVLNLCLTPVEVMCIPLFARLGGYLLPSDGADFNISELVSGLQSNFFHTLGAFQLVLLRAVLGWLVWVGPAMFAIYVIALPALTKTSKKRDAKRMV